MNFTSPRPCHPPSNIRLQDFFDQPFLWPRRARWTERVTPANVARSLPNTTSNTSKPQGFDPSRREPFACCHSHRSRANRDLRWSQRLSRLGGQRLTRFALVMHSSSHHFLIHIGMCSSSIVFSVRVIVRFVYPIVLLRLLPHHPLVPSLYGEVVATVDLFRISVSPRGSLSNSHDFRWPAAHAPCSQGLRATAAHQTHAEWLDSDQLRWRHWSRGSVHDQWEVIGCQAVGRPNHCESAGSLAEKMSTLRFAAMNVNPVSGIDPIVSGQSCHMFDFRVWIAFMKTRSPQLVCSEASLFRLPVFPFTSLLCHFSRPRILLLIQPTTSSIRPDYSLCGGRSNPGFHLNSLSIPVPHQ